MTADVPTTRAISDEARTAAADAVLKAMHHYRLGQLPFDVAKRYANAAIDSALPHLAQPSDEAMETAAMIETDGWSDVDQAKILEAAQDGAAWALIEWTMDTTDRDPSADDLNAARETARKILAQSSGRGADHALAEKIAQAIEAHYLGADFGRNYDGTESPETALGHAHDEALEHAARIARTFADEVTGR